MPHQHQQTNIKLISVATQTLVSIRGFFPEAKLSQTRSKSTSKQTMSTSLVCVSERSALGYASLSACRCGWFKLLYTCTDEGLAVLLCVNHWSQQRD